MFELLISCFDIARFGEHEISLFEHPEKPPAGPYASKNPTDFIHVCRVMRWDRGLHVIYMQRDPRDVIVSQHGRFPGRYWCDFDVWRRNQELLPRLKDHPRFFLCRYEDLVAEPDVLQRALQQRFGFLTPTHRFSQFQDVAQSSEYARMALNGIRRIDPSSTGKWRESLPRVLAQVQKFPDLPDYVIHAGYEPDRAWLSLLDGVTPDRAESIRVERDELRGKSGLARIGSRLQRRLASFRMELLYSFRALGLIRR